MMETSYGGQGPNRNIQFYQNNMLGSPQPHGPPAMMDSSALGDQNYLSGSDDPLAYQSTPSKYGGMSRTNGFSNPYSLSPQQQQMLYGPPSGGNTHPLHP